MAPDPVDVAHSRRWRSNAAAVLAGVAVVTGVALRFATTSALWLDEAQTVAIARLPIRDIPDALRHDGAPPLYYVVLHLWMSVFGDGDVAVRALSGLVSVATVAVVAYAVHRLAGRGAAIAAVLLATNPFAIRYATEARMYGLLALEVAVAVLITTAIIRRPADRWPVGALAATVAAILYTHYWGLYLVGAAAVLATVWYLWPAVRRYRHVPGRLLVAMAAGVVLWLPWLPTFSYQLHHTGTPWDVPPPLGTVVTALFDLNGGLSGGGLTLTAVALAGAAVALFGRRTVDGQIELRGPRVDPAVGLLAVAVVTLAIGIGAGRVFGVAYAGRYATVALVPFAMAAAMGVARLDAVARRALVAAAAVVGLITALSAVGAQRTEASRFASVLTRASAGDVVVYCPDQLGPATYRLVGDRLVQLAYPRGDVPAMVDWVDYADAWQSGTPRVFAARADALAGAHDLWLVISTSYHGTETDCGALLEALQRQRPGGAIAVRANGHYFENGTLWKLPAG